MEGVKGFITSPTYLAQYGAILLTLALHLHAEGAFGTAHTHR